jgi:hypothetical protein
VRDRLIFQPKARGENDGPADAGANCGEAFEQIETAEMSRQLRGHVPHIRGRGSFKPCANVIICDVITWRVLKLRRKCGRRFVVQQHNNPTAQ